MAPQHHASNNYFKQLRCPNTMPQTIVVPHHHGAPSPHFLCCPITILPTFKQLRCPTPCFHDSNSCGVTSTMLPCFKASNSCDVPTPRLFVSNSCGVQKPSLHTLNSCGVTMLPCFKHAVVFQKHAYNAANSCGVTNTMLPCFKASNRCDVPTLYQTAVVS